jgi:hypothetical protein
MSDLQQSFGWELGFIDHLQVVTTNNYKSIMELLQIS